MSFIPKTLLNLDPHSTATGVLAGVVLTSVSVVLASSVSSLLSGSSWISLVAASALLGAAASALARRPAEPSGARTPQAPAYVGTANALDPASWLAANFISITEVVGADDKMEGLIAAALAKQLSPNGSSQHPAIEVLALSLAIQATGDNLLAATLRKGLDESFARTPQGDADYEHLLALVSPETKRAAESVGAAAYAKHGMRETAMLSLMRSARKSGTVVSAQFPWLKRLDRPLWYALNNDGRKGIHVEGAAAMSHFAAELRSGTAISTPQVDAAVASIVEYAHSEFSW